MIFRDKKTKGVQLVTNNEPWMPDVSLDDFQIHASKSRITRLQAHVATEQKQIYAFTNNTEIYIGSIGYDQWSPNGCGFPVPFAMCPSVFLPHVDAIGQPLEIELPNFPSHHHQ